jgi:very-short-patch-repair endonuclease
VGRPARTALERASAAVLACGPHAALSHAAALALWGLTPHWPATFDVTVTSGNPRPRGITVHRSRTLAGQDVRTQLGIRTTSPARTILDCLPEIEPWRRTRAVNDALLTPFVTRPQLADVCGRCPTHPGVRLLRPFVVESDGPTRSHFEDRFRRFCTRFGFPRPRVNTRVAGHEVDALFPADKLIIEMDGWDYHRDRHAFETDRDRDADTLAAGYSTLRMTWVRLDERPEAEAARLVKILRQLRMRRPEGA